MRTDKSNDKNKTKFPPPSTPVTVFLIAENYYVCDFESFGFSVCVTFCEKFSTIAWMGNFVLKFAWGA